MRCTLRNLALHPNLGGEPMLVSLGCEKMQPVRLSLPILSDEPWIVRLQDELAGTKNRIAVERRKYNETVQKYNTQLPLFPNNIIAS